MYIKNVGNNYKNIRMKNFSNSIRSILEERISSPFYGTLIISWILWNWKIFYITFFIKSKDIGVNKIDYIIQNCNEVHQLVTYPIISTLIILTIMPFITNGAYWITFLFDSWRIKKKNEILNNQLLTLEQSVQLRIEMNNSEEKYEKLLNSRDLEIQNLKKQHELALKSKDGDIDNLKKQANSTLKNTSINEKEKEELIKLRKHIQNQNSGSYGVGALHQNELNELINNQEKLMHLDRIANADIHFNNLNNGTIPFHILISYEDSGLLIRDKNTNQYVPTEKCKYLYSEYNKILKEKTIANIV